MNGAGDELTHSKRKGVSKSHKHTYTGVPTIDYDDVRDEKPWQRVFYEIARKGTHLYEPVKSVPSPFIILVLGVYLLLGYLTQLVEDGMPRVVQEADLARDNSDTFSEESARNYMYAMVGDQPRVAGTLYHYQKTVELKDMLDSIAAQATLPVRTDWQMVTGDYWLNYSSPHVNYYQNLSNIIAVLEGESGFHSNGTIGSSILLNCHYDSVPYALGASDNIVFCAVMAETLTKLSKRREKFKHNIIFLFNGAEENPLQASHGFLQHPWSRGVIGVVNLDAAGMNGKPNLFQVTDPRVLNAYKRVTPRPNAQAFGEFLFSSGIVPSDTDFRIWRDFGQFYGVDIAFSKWGHVYHTRYDHPALVRGGVLQCAGDMLLPLTAELADMEELNDKVSPTPAVYYDYLNLFMVWYSLRAAHAVDAAVLLLAGLSVAYYMWLVGLRRSTVRELLYSALGRVASTAAGVLVVAVLAPLMVTTTIQLRYLTQPWIVVPLFWVPYLVGAVATSHAFDRWRAKRSGLNRSLRAVQAMAATRLILATILLVMFCVPSMTTLRYVLSVPLFIMSLMALVSLSVVRCIRLEGWQHLLLELFLSLPASLFMFTLALRLDALMLPVMGRTPTDVPDYIVAALNVALAALAATTLSGMEVLFSRRRLWAALCALLAACVVVMFVPMSPYQDDGPSTQRHYWFHTEIVTYNASLTPVERVSGVLVTKHDAYSLERVLPALRERGVRVSARRGAAGACDTRVFCNLPLYRTRFGDYLEQSLFLFTGPPAQQQPPPSLRVTARSCAADTCSLEFTMVGAPHNMITLWPRANVTLSAWSFASPARSTAALAGRPVYVIVHSTATYSPSAPPTVFTVHFNVPSSLQPQPLVDVSHHAHKIHHPEEYTPEYRRLLDSAPPYFNVATFLTVRSNYQF